jgi:hypothetical protein
VLERDVTATRSKAALFFDSILYQNKPNAVLCAFAFFPYFSLPLEIT